MEIKEVIIVLTRCLSDLWYSTIAYEWTSVRIQDRRETTNRCSRPGFPEVCHTTLFEMIAKHFCGRPPVHGIDRTIHFQCEWGKRLSFAIGIIDTPLHNELLHEGVEVPVELEARREDNALAKIGELTIPARLAVAMNPSHERGVPIVRRMSKRSRSVGGRDWFRSCFT